MQTHVQTHTCTHTHKLAFEKLYTVAMNSFALSVSRNCFKLEKQGLWKRCEDASTFLTLQPASTSTLCQALQMQGDTVIVLQTLRVHTQTHNPPASDSELKLQTCITVPG